MTAKDQANLFKATPEPKENHPNRLKKNRQYTNFIKTIQKIIIKNPKDTKSQEIVSFYATYAYLLDLLLLVILSVGKRLIDMIIIEEGDEQCQKTGLQDKRDRVCGLAAVLIYGNIRKKMKRL